MKRAADDFEFIYRRVKELQQQQETETETETCKGCDCPQNAGNDCAGGCPY